MRHTELSSNQSISRSFEITNRCGQSSYPSAPLPGAYRGHTPLILLNSKQRIGGDCSRVAAVVNVYHVHHRETSASSSCGMEAKSSGIKTARKGRATECKLWQDHFVCDEKRRTIRVMSRLI